MKYFSGLLEILNEQGEMIRTIPVTALAKRSKIPSGDWKYTVRVGLAYDLADKENTSIVLVTAEGDWLTVVEKVIAKDSEHDKVRFFLFHEVKI